MAQIVVDSTRLKEQEQYLTSFKERKKELKNSLRKAKKEKKAFLKDVKEYAETNEIQTGEQMTLKFLVLDEAFKSEYPIANMSRISNMNELDIPSKYKKKYKAYQKRWESEKSEWAELTQSDSTLQTYLKSIRADSLLLSETENRLRALIDEELKKGELPISEDMTQRLKGNYLNELGDQLSLPEWQKSLPDNLYEVPQQMLGKVDERQIVDGLAGKADLVESAKSNLQALKEKYSYVPNSEDLSTAIKDTDLGHKTFYERLVFGGTFQFLPNQDGFKLDLAPSVGYGINKKFTVFLGASYRADFNVDKLGASPSKVIGAKTFGQYDFFKGFLLHAEYEYLVTKTEATETVPSLTKKTGGFLAGLAKEFGFLKKVNAQVQWLYHFSHEKSGAYNSPWVFRIGFVNNSNR